MTDITVLIAQRNAAGKVAAQVPAVCRALAALDRDYELIVVDDASSTSSIQPLLDLARSHNHLRLMRLQPACGLSAALTVGIREAHGQYVVTLPAGDPCAPPLIEPLLDELVRADLVVGRPRRNGISKAIHRLVRIPRWLLLGLEVRDPECLVWAARREAIEGLQLPRGMYRYLATLVSSRGYRVSEITVPTSGRSQALSDGWCNPGDLMAAWWFKRRWQQYEVTQFTHQTGQPAHRIVGFGPLNERSGIHPPTESRRRSALTTWPASSGKSAST